MPSKKILLVEDDNFLNQLYFDLLKSEGYDVVSSTEGNDALTKCKKKGWDLILLDVMLPGKDGFEILDEVSKIDKNIGKKIIFLTNMEKDGMKNPEYLNKAKGCWVKSNMSPPEFIEKVKNVLK
ncbi:MAG: hypothetical protein COU27_02770 [Candidatus Levybacteria bacterium CG10_big_fil_rev_8_21_14_0_10_36_7]|nr:MAG: hypothetical protein COU27_02770 [Candidatus Levybacteria bacterium CG10_big_fil_rev_8_21_14_0_10_36_7]